MKLAIPSPERGFKLSRKGDYVLVTPGPTKLGHSDWDESEYLYRSVVIHEPTEEIVSLGFPKFFNYGEGWIDGKPSNNDARLLYGFLSKHDEDIFFTEKIDGSMICRSVVDDEVWIRTRGTLQENDHTQLARKIIEDRYPKLFDPEFMPWATIIFELISPSLRIILPYERDDLILIGVVDHDEEHSEPLYFTFPMLEYFAAEHDFNLVKTHQLPVNIDKLIETVSNLDDKEGIVVRYGDTLVKMKSARYLALHRLRFALSIKRIKEICLERNVMDLEDFEAFLGEYEADWELFSDTKPLVESFIEARLEANIRYDKLVGIVDSLKDIDRKSFATEYVTKFTPAEKMAAFLLRDGRIEEAWKKFLKAEIDNAFVNLESLDEALTETNS